jgi:dTDP-D-glucose 4,6-dehydratase
MPDPQSQLSEANYLLLDSAKARATLGWTDKLNFDKSVSLTSDWYLSTRDGSALSVTRSQIDNFRRID